MPTFQTLTTAQLRQILQLREQIETAQQKLDTLLGGIPLAKSKSSRFTGKRTMSAATKKKMAAAQQARWAKLKGGATGAKAPTAKKSKMSPEAKAKIAAAMKARWAAKKMAAE